MSRRPPPAEQQFGSDSFLDVVANVVGILIILMVLAGVRASRAPVTLTPQEPNITTEEPRELAAVPTLASPTEDLAERHREELAELQSQAEKLQDELNVARTAAADHEQRLSELQSQDAATRNRLTAVGSTLDRELSTLAQSREQIAKLTAAAQSVRVKLKDRQNEIAALEKQPHKVKQLEHRITPVSRVLKENETELHFRCLGGQVTLLPISELASRIKGQMERQRDVIVRAPRYRGEVGPVRGFSMNYLVEREVTLDGLVYARVSYSELVPEADLDGETAAVALQSNSIFRNELRKAEPGSTITFYVYSDSFSLYRQLQNIAHREGFAVAARPLPIGEPIGFSPSGSRSAAQ